MKFVALVATEGAMPAEAIAEMNRDWPAYEREHRTGFRVGRELDLPEAGVTTVRVRDGELLLTDGPFVESKEFVAGIEVFESADLAAAVALQSRNPVARFNPFEIRQLTEAFQIGPDATAFADGDDSRGIPFLLTIWAESETIETDDERALVQACNDWRGEAGGFVMGGPIGARDAATTLRARDGQVEAGAGPFLDIPQFITGIEVVRAADLPGAVRLAGAHPLARSHAIEVRSFYRSAG